jgi:hypothetical protein
MDLSYRCPHCRSVLNRDATIILSASCGDEQIMIGFHPKPGNYEVLLPPGFELEPGSLWAFSCPACSKSLESDQSSQLCCLDMVANNERRRVYFSRVAGERATFVISAEGIERHGEHASLHSLEILDLV